MIQGYLNINIEAMMYIVNHKKISPLGMLVNERFNYFKSSFKGSIGYILLVFYYFRTIIQYINYKSNHIYYKFKETVNQCVGFSSL